MNTETVARRRYDIALRSLINAGDLLTLLMARPLPENDYYAEAVRRAERLVDECRADVDSASADYNDARRGTP
jgi:hypothetical protein